MFKSDRQRRFVMNLFSNKFSEVRSGRMHLKSIGPREVEIDIDGNKKIADDDDFVKVVNAISPTQRVQLIDGYKLNEADLRIYKNRIKHIYDDIEV